MHQEWDGVNVARRVVKTPNLIENHALMLGHGHEALGHVCTFTWENKYTLWSVCCNLQSYAIFVLSSFNGQQETRGSHPCRYQAPPQVS